MIWKIDDMETQPSSTWKKGSLLIFYIYDVRHLSSVDQSKKEALMTQAKLQSDYSCVPFYSGHRAVGIGRQGGDHQIGRSVNPIPTRGSIMSTLLLKYGFCKKSLRKNETLISWTLLAHFFSRSVLISADLEKKWAKSVQLVRVSFFRSDFLQNPYFNKPFH